MQISLGFSLGSSLQLSLHKFVFTVCTTNHLGILSMLMITLIYCPCTSSLPQTLITLLMLKVQCRHKYIDCLNADAHIFKYKTPSHQHDMIQHRTLSEVCCRLNITYVKTVILNSIILNNDLNNLMAVQTSSI